MPVPLGTHESPRIAMFGGTFDPVHLGHLRSAVELRDALALDYVHMLPAARPPLREAPGVSAEHRLELLQLGIGDTPGLVADGRELKRSGPSFSADTLAELRAEYGDQARLVMALGHDAFLRLADWHEPERLFELAHVVVMERPDHDAPLSNALSELIAGREVNTPAQLMASTAGGLLHLSLPTRMAVSATYVRQRLARGCSVRYLLTADVERHLLALGLYGTGVGEQLG
ncbi:nicotinate-nucleotide adenylyltransferase [Halomonas halocynthiae]|uniref:nicotinate-nucleotide adenylyltransferase n=1 Tax=Halomonas halocynthiae TaxID=176290 RepID=UPI0004292483|nr:nicotinate-nucleotide adenylyltransferase [Halomonas halocynthiae]